MIFGETKGGRDGKNNQYWKPEFRRNSRKRVFSGRQDQFDQRVVESADSVTLITRPRRFGKTINMDMLNCFFSNRFQGRGDLFEGLSIWKEEVYRRLQGSYPVIFLSFADVKQNNCKDAIQKIKTIITGVYRQF